MPFSTRTPHPLVPSGDSPLSLFTALCEGEQVLETQRSLVSKHQLWTERGPALTHTLMVSEEHHRTSPGSPQQDGQAQHRVGDEHPLLEQQPSLPHSDSGLDNLPCGSRIFSSMSRDDSHYCPKTPRKCITTRLLPSEINLIITCRWPLVAVPQFKMH